MEQVEQPKPRLDAAARSTHRHRPQKTAMLVAAAIVNRITNQGLQVGDVLPPERILVEEYEVGRGTMREALRYLELQGVLWIKPGPRGGPVVASPDSRHLAATLALLMQFSDTEFRAVVEARQHLEPITARLAAVSLTSELSESLQGSVRAMEENLDDWDFFLDENRRFHDYIAWGSGNPLFGYFINSLHWITDGTVLGIDYPLRFRESVLHAHRSIADAVSEGNPALSEAAMQSHLDDTLEYFENRYPQILDQKLKWEHFG